MVMNAGLGVRLDGNSASPDLPGTEAGVIGCGLLEYEMPLPPRSVFLPGYYLPAVQ